MTGVLATLAALRDGSATPLGVARACLDAMAAYDDPAVWISRVPDEALLARAAELERDPQARGLPLYGVPFAVKDNIDVAGLETTAACPAYAYRPAHDATVVSRLRAAGAMVVGKTNLDQFATGLVGTRSPYGAPRSVFSKAHVSGGSSSGSAVAVAAGLVSFALGTDTAGSGRVPAAFNNIVGLKPTRGLIPTTGAVPACRSLDCMSIFAESSADALAVLAVAQGFDAADPYARPPNATLLPGHGLRFGVLNAPERSLLGSGSDRLYESAIGHLVDEGATPVLLDMAPFLNAAALLYDGPFVAERLAGIAAFVESRADAMDPIVRGIVAGAARYSAADAFAGEYARRSLLRLTGAAWKAMDIMLLPTTALHPTVAAVAADPVGLNAQLGRWTNFVNLLDLAAIAVPAGFCGDGLPFGVSLIGPAFCDRALAGVADRVHRRSRTGSGRTYAVALPDMPVEAPAGIAFAVAGAHLSGMPLNQQLIELGATLERKARTAINYRLFALPGTVPPKPGLVRSPGHVGLGIEVEIWRLSEAAFGRFVADLPPPMGIGPIVLSDGAELPGFLCETCALAGATDITHFGGWRAYRQAQG